MDDITKQPKVIVFSTPTCSYCNAAKSYFRQKGVKYKDVDVSRDAAAARATWCAARASRACPSSTSAAKSSLALTVPKSTSCSVSNRPAVG